MTSIDFLNKVHKNLDSQEYSLSYSPAKSKNFMLYCNGNFIGGLFDEELCFVYADSVSELLGQPEPVYRGYSSTAQHRMLVIPEEHWERALKLLYAEKFDWSRLVYDITYTSIGAAVVEDFYDENVVFLRFCFEKELLKKDPLDRQGRILRMVYLNQDLTKAGKYLFPRLMQKFLVFTDRKGKTTLETMLNRWYIALEKEYRNHICCWTAMPPSMAAACPPCKAASWTLSLSTAPGWMMPVYSRRPPFPNSPTFRSTISFVWRTMIDNRSLIRNKEREVPTWEHGA